MIQTQINNFGKVAPPPGFYAKLAKGAIMEINANEMHFFTDARISKQVPIPIRVGTKPFEVSIVQNPGPDERELAKLELMDPIDVWVHNELQIPLNSKIVVKNENQKHVREILKQIASEQGISELKLQAKFKPTITVFGFTLYSGLPLYRNIDIGSVSSKINSLEPAAFPTEVDESGESLMDKMLIFKNPDNGKLKSMYNEEDISTLPSGWSWVWKSLITSMDDESFEVTAAAAFENTTPFETIPIDAFEFYLHIENIRIVKISLTKLGLASGFNGDFDAGYKMTFIDDLIDPVQVQNAIEVALKNLNSGDFSFGLAGPMKLTKADWISSVSPEMSLKFRMSSVRSLVQTRVGAFVKQSNSSMLNMLGLENSKINFMVLADRMKTVANINLKTWANIKPPLDLKFPYTASLNVFAGGSEKVMEIISNPITATRSPIGMMINTDCEVIPVNSDAAATALANAINPSISVNPQPSTLGLRDFAFHAPGLPNFKWADRFFSTRIIEVSVPAINIQNILNSQVSSGGGVSLPKLGGSINLHQLQDRSGFGVDGELEVPVIPGMPDITIDIGFVGVASIVDQSRLIGLELLNGIKYSRAVKRMPINATAVLSKDPQTKSSFVKVGNTITGTGEQFSAVGISNFRIGSSPASQIVTFNKLVIELPADFVKSKMVDMIGKIKATNPAESSVPLVKLTSANFQMSSGTNLMFECTSLVNNPVKGLSLDIGTLELQLLLDDSTLVALKISPIQLSQGQSPLTLKVYMKLSDGSNNMDQKVATLVDVVVNKNINSNLLVGVTGIRMSPANANPEAIVDQVSDMKVNIAIGKILSELGSGDAAPRPSALDITALVPSIDLDLKNLFSVSSAQVAALSGQILSLSSNLNYRNPIPVSASIPFFTIDTIVDGSRIVTTAVTGIEIVQIQGEFQPKINLNFNNDASVPDKVESLYNQLDLKKISSKLEIGGLSFGTEEMKNQLFRFVKLDATSYLQIILDKAPSTTNFDPMAVKLITVNLDKSLQVATEFTKTKEIRIDAKLPLNSSISIELNIPYFRIDSYLDDSEAFSIGLNDLNTKLVTGQTQPLGINIVIGVHDTEDLSWSIAKLVDSVLKSEKLTGRAGVGGFKIGVSEHDYITAFYKLRVIKEIDLIGGQIIRDIMRSPPNLPQVPQLSLLSEMVTLQNVNIEALIQKAIAVNINAHVANPMNISVKGLNYISNSVGINKAEVVFVELNALNDLVVKAGPNNISIGLNMKFSGERISKQMVNTLYQESLEKLGEQKSIFTTTGIQFGVDKENSFKFLSRTVLAYNSNKVINDESVTQVKSIIFAARKNSTLPIAFKLNEVDVEFSPEKSIDSKVKANIELPFDVTVDVPFIKFGSKLNEHRFFDVGILGATTKATSNYIEFTTSLEFHDTPDIASSIEKLVSEYSVSESSTTLVGRLGSQLEVGRDGKFEILETPKEIGSGSILMKRIIDNIQGTIGGGFISFGIDATPENLIDIFDQLSLDMSSRDVINTALSMVPSFNGSSSTPIDNLNLALKNLKGGTAPGRIVKSSFTAQFSNDIGVNISLKGFGFLSVVSGVAGDKGAAAVTALQLGGLSILPGNNSIDMNAELFFPPSPNVIDIVGDFSKNILNNFGHTREKLFATGLRFGHSAESSFQFLSKAKFGVESSKFINAHMLQKLISGHNFTAPSADAFGISNVKIISSSTGAIVIDSSATVKSVPFTADASIGFLKATTIIDQKPLLDLSVLSGIQLKSDRRDLNVGFSGELAFHSDEDIQTAVASLAQAIFKNDVSTSSEVGGVGFAFGSDSKNENIVDTFSKVSISVLVQRFIPEIHKIYQSSLTSLTDVESFLQMSSNSTISFPIVMKRAVVDVPEKNTLSIDTLADVSSLPFKAAIDIPHLSLSIRSNKDEIIRTNILNTKVSSDGQVSTLVNIKFQENDAAFQNLFEVANRIQAHKVEANDDLITTHSIAFGSSEKKILTFQKVEFPLRIKPIVDKLIQKQPDPNANIVHNWWSVFTEQGIVTLFELWEDNGLADFSWLKIKAKITAKTAVQKDREGEVVFVANIAVLDINIPKINAVLAPIIENDSTARGLFLGTEKFLGFKDFGSDGRNGYAVLTGTTGAKLTAFQNCWVWAGEVVLFHPMTLNLVPSWIWDPRDPLQLRAPLMTLLSFKNGGPLHMDIGKMTLTAFKNGRKMFALESKGDWVIRNWLEGAGDFQKPLNQGKFFFEFSIRLVTPFALIDLIDGLIHRNEMQFSLILKRGDQEISWAPKVFDALYKMGGLAALGPMIGKILKNINFRVFGIGKRRRESTITIGDTVKRSDVNASATSDLWDDDLQHPTNLTVIMDPFENLEPVVMVDTPNIIIVAR